MQWRKCFLVPFVLLVLGVTACGKEDASTETAETSCSVYFLDVGQGDSELIVTDSAAILIDAGEIGQGDNVLAYLNECGVDTLDWIITTHPHSDHIGGVPEILTYVSEYNDLTVENILIPALPDSMTPTTKVYERMLDGAEENGIAVSEATEMEIDLGSATLEIIPPPSDYSDLNNYSICAYLTCGETSFFFTGDASADEERDLLEGDLVRHADVLKVGHHGSRESSTEEFLVAVTPEYAVISCGANNSYGHPTDEALNRLDVYCDGNIWRTDEDGTVCITSDGQSLTVTTHALEG